MNLHTVFLRFGQMLAFTSMVLMSQSLHTAEQSRDLQNVTTDNLPAFVSQLSEDYYQQLTSLIDFYQLYQQKRDPRGFNVWHLRGFSPAFGERQAYYDHLLNSADPDSQAAVANLVNVFNDLGSIATQLMVSFRDNDPAAYQQAKLLIRDNNVLLAQQLKQYQQDSTISEINLP